MNRNAIIEQLKKDEGFTPKAKWDVDNWRYGYGCTAPYEGAPISENIASELLSVRVDQAIQEFHGVFGDQYMSDIRQGALVNMFFNMGKGSTKTKKGVLGFPKMISAIKSNNWEEAANQAKDSLWYRQLKDSGDPPGRARRIVSELRNGG